MSVINIHRSGPHLERGGGGYQSSKHQNKRREEDQKQELMLKTVSEPKRHTQQLNDRSSAAADVNYT